MRISNCYRWKEIIRIWLNILKNIRNYKRKSSLFGVWNCFVAWWFVWVLEVETFMFVYSILGSRKKYWSVKKMPLMKTSALKLMLRRKTIAVSEATEMIAITIMSVALLTVIVSIRNNNLRNRCFKKF